MIQDLLARLAEMFPTQDYDQRLKNYLATKHITDHADLERLISRFDRDYQRGILT